MINGAHVILYSRDADADRAFIRDVLGFAGVDAGGGWLIFKLPPAEVAVHPTDGDPQHELYLMCDDIGTALEELFPCRTSTGPRPSTPIRSASSPTTTTGSATPCASSS